MPQTNVLDESRNAARTAGLRYVNTDRHGILRKRSGRGFRYVTTRGAPVRDPAVLQRIRALAIPPAWSDVWICPDARGHIQAIGWDARGRKQYRYHARFRSARDAEKFAHMIEFATHLPRIRARVERDLRRADLSRARVQAAIVRLLDRVHARVGNEEYARTNRHFGLTTLCKHHARVSGAQVRFAYLGKGGAERRLELRDPRVATVVKHCRSFSARRLFVYENGHGYCPLRSNDVNAYLCEAAGCHITAKDFRTWTATVDTAIALMLLGPKENLAARKRCLLQAIAAAAEELGNTLAVCRSSYIHPVVLTSYMDGTLCEELQSCQALERRHRTAGLTLAEGAVLRFLRRQNH